MPFSPRPTPSVPDVDLASFALRHAVRLADRPALIDDRIKELIKVKGFQVAPAELEAVLRSHPAVADAAVVRVPDRETGERPKAFVVASGELDHDELRSYAAEQVADYKRIDEIEEIDALPRSPTGKLLRRMLVAEPVA